MQRFLPGSFVVAVFAAAALSFLTLPAFGPIGSAMAGEGHDHGQAEVEKVSWQEKLKAQIEREESAEGRMGNRDKVQEAMQKLMSEIAGAAGPETMSKGGTGGYGGMGTMMQMDQNFYLGPTGVSESVSGNGRCPKYAPVREFDITAINLEITLNQWQDFHPGYMYALTKDLDKIREEERRNSEARKNDNDPGAVSTGLQTDLIQPLTIRANQGDCVLVTLRNEVEDEDVSLHIHGSSMILRETGSPATIANPASTVATGESQNFEWYISPDEQEGAKAFHSHYGREQASLGMIGTFIVEPMGSKYIDPITNQPAESGWQMMIVNDNFPDFREFVLVYHEIGDESFRPLNRFGDMIPQRDPNTDAYRPSARAMNYRSEPFGVNNLAVQEKYFHFEDESLSYSSYTFGDAPTTIPRSYLGDPVKFRLVHGGGEVFHSHHPHGGTIRWL
ncbi:MAG TPA: multicopper oxidase domain-containing protein, partial [Nitrospiria bacterium]|nr:multicopper oxidase domain-containing protein [Nitrospiria bacterium]